MREILLAAFYMNAKSFAKLKALYGEIVLVPNQRDFAVEDRIDSIFFFWLIYNWVGVYMINIDLFKVIPMIISALAFTVSYLGYKKISKIDDNSMIRLIVAGEILESDFKTLRAIHSRAHLFGEKNEEMSDELNVVFNKLESRIELLYGLLLQNKKIGIQDLRRIIKSLEEIELNLMELKYYEIETLKDLEDTRAIVNLN